MDRHIKILIIDDDPVFTRLIEVVLTRAGYQVFRAGSGREGLQVVFGQRPELVLLDIALPGIDGWQTCRRIRDMCDVPIIMLSGSSDAEKDIVRGLGYGADDYIIKPVGSKELVARIQAVLRRTREPSSVDGATYSDDRLSINIGERMVMLDGERVGLTPKEFGLLALLVQNAGRVVPHRVLLEKVWGWEYTDDMHHVRIYIWHLRRKIEPEPASPRYIITEAGVGYRFNKAGVKAKTSILPAGIG
jgi:two-component system KDP operon response regulator KdpE